MLQAEHGFVEVRQPRQPSRDATARRRHDDDSPRTGPQGTPYRHASVDHPPERSAARVVRGARAGKAACIFPALPPNCNGFAEEPPGHGTGRCDGGRDLVRHADGRRSMDSKTAHEHAGCSKQYPVTRLQRCHHAVRFCVRWRGVSESSLAHPFIFEMNATVAPVGSSVRQMGESGSSCRQFSMPQHGVVIKTIEPHSGRRPMSRY